MKQPKKHAYAAVVAMLLLGQAGCATLGLSTTRRSPEEIGTQLGRIGVASAQYVPRTHYGTPPKGSAAGAALGAVGGFLGGAVYGQGFGAVLLGPLYTIAGATTARPAAEVQKAELALVSAFTDTKIQEAMRDRVFELVQVRTDHPVVPVSGLGPSISGEQPDYRSLATEGIQAVLEISVEVIALRPTQSASLNIGNPSLRLETTALGRVVSVQDNTELFRRTFGHSGETYKFFKWAENNAEPFGEELNRVSNALGAKIVDELFCSGSSGACKEAIREEADQSP